MKKLEEFLHSLMRRYDDIKNLAFSRRIINRPLFGRVLFGSKYAGDITRPYPAA